MFKYCVVVLCTLFAFGTCQLIGDQFRAGQRNFGMSSSEEMYHYEPPDEYYYNDQQHFHPEPEFRAVHHYPSIPALYEPMPIMQPHPDMVVLDGLPNHEMYPREPYFQPEVRAGAFDNPLKKMMEPAKKQLGDSFKGLTDSMGKQAEEMGKQMGETAGKKMTEMMQKQGDEFGKQLEGALEDGQKQVEDQVESAKDGAEDAGQSVGSSVPKPDSSDSDIKKKLDGGAGSTVQTEQLKDNKKSVEDAAGGPMKNMQDAGSKIKKSIPIPGSLIGRIRGETAKVHEDYGDFPRAEAMEWGSPDFVDVRNHPRSRYFDYYYDGGY